MDYKRNRRYFETINWMIAIILLVFGVIFLYVYLWLGIVCLLGLGMYVYFGLKDKPADGEIDALIKNQIQISLQKGNEQAIPNQETSIQMNSVMIHGPSVQAISYDPAMRRGKDHLVRSSNYDIHILYFGEQQLYLYNYCFSLIDDERNETITEYFYRDIVSLSIAQTMHIYFDNIRKRDDILSHDTFKITVMDGTIIECPMKDLEDMRESLRQVKDLIRMKKSV